MKTYELRSVGGLLSVLLVSVISVAAASTENGAECTTPNGEKAKCIPVNSCNVIRRAISYFEEEAVQFAKESQCGYDDGPLVCCGSVGKRTTIPPPDEKTTTVRPITSKDTDPAKPIKHSLLPDETLCGYQSANLKKSGRIAEDVEHPWTVALNYDNGANGYFGCSGVLINNRYVVTSAECLFIPGLKLKSVRLGVWKFSENVEKDEDDKAAVIDIPIKKTISHPYYNKKNGNNNIALIRLNQKVNFTEFIRPICLPPSDYPQPPSGDLMEASGWGLTQDGSKSDVKLKTPIVMVGYDECQETFPGYIRRFPSKACGKGVHDFCNGEAGIPLVKKYVKPNNTAETLEEQWYLEGIISKGFGCVENTKETEKSKQPSLYFRVSRYTRWILNNLRS